MNSQTTYTIAVLGAGNVATHISRHLHARGHRISCIWSRTRERSELLADQVNAMGLTDLGKVPEGADFYLLAVPDRAIPQVASVFEGKEGIWMHMAGAVPMEILVQFFDTYGVFYPLQTFSSEREISLEDTPILVEGSGMEELGKIQSLASSVSEMVLEMDSPRRLAIHMAAVFANNFSNHMVAIAGQILEEHDADFSLLEPILRETYAKIKSMGPVRAQTGPAVREDHVTMQEHLELLKGHPEWKKLYTFVSRDISRSRLNTAHDPKKGNDQL